MIADRSPDPTVDAYLAALVGYVSWATDLPSVAVAAGAIARRKRPALADVIAKERDHRAQTHPNLAAFLAAVVAQLCEVQADEASSFESVARRAGIA
jgi:hypothetical protein